MIHAILYFALLTFLISFLGGLLFSMLAAVADSATTTGYSVGRVLAGALKFFILAAQAIHFQAKLLRIKRLRSTR